MAVENVYITLNLNFNLNLNPNFFKLTTTLIPTLIPTIMAPMELLQAEKITKHSDGIIAATAIKEELGEYITTKVYIYVQEEFIDYILQTIFQEEFHRFTANDFKKIYSKLKVKLQIHLFKKGVYITIYNNRYTLLEVLFDVF